MFFDPDRIIAMREMILSKNAKYRKSINEIIASISKERISIIY